MATPTTTRRESAHALRRKSIRLVHLKSVDLVATDDVLRFAYKARAWAAHVTIDGYVACLRHAAHSRADRQTGMHSMYKSPTNFTNDCVAVFWAEKRSADACHTNPSGYDRVIHERSGKSLNELRDEYMTRFMDASALPLADLLGSAPARTKRRLAPPAPALPAAVAPLVVTGPAALGHAVAALLDDGAVSIATVRAQAPELKYKAIAEQLQAKLARHRQMLRDLLAYTHTLAASDARTLSDAARPAASAPASAPILHVLSSPVSPPPAVATAAASEAALRALLDVSHTRLSGD